MRSIRCDVLVIGAGAAGAVVAATLAQAGRKVVLVERGGYYTGPELKQNELAAAQLYAGGGNRPTTDGAYHVTGGECVGGGTLVNYALVRSGADGVGRLAQVSGSPGSVSTPRLATTGSRA